MAVQAPNPSNAFGSRRARQSTLDDLQMMRGYRDPLQFQSSLDQGDAGMQHQMLNNTTVFTDPQSELTCNASGSRKRAREESMALPVLAPLFRGPNSATASMNPVGDKNICGVLPQCRLLESTATATSGRFVSASQAVAPLFRDLISLIYQQTLEMDALVRLQNERLRTGLEEARKRHCRVFLSAVEQLVTKRLMEKEIELERAVRRNAELEEKVRQTSEENQIWFSMAKNNEAVVSSLKASLGHALLQNAAVAAREGYGDSKSTPLRADDANSCCFEVEEDDTGWRKTCRACRGTDACVLLLPCRHVSLCKDCEPEADACPVCGSAKNACLQVRFGGRRAKEGDRPISVVGEADMI
ncbi:hypothetical protein OPV22_026836 [Ensete ventricosum]|uniref:RING-type domain-containing protein n=1 Tax=Ensete ventricosum TaxID=4639 RepID=A0AAV8PYS2_ENSVE|nr:hypothetical protein OPV22_026836 [Ensete ventricosum]